MSLLVNHVSAVQEIFPEADLSTCPFTSNELAELEYTNELLVHVPARMPPEVLAKRCSVRANISFADERCIKNVMSDIDQWFITKASPIPELLYVSGTDASRIYEDEGLHGMDLRRYLAFAATYNVLCGEMPDQTYWTFLLSGKYDRSGVSIVGFDVNHTLSHHGWMRNFKAKFAGSRYVVLPPRIEVTEETAQLRRAYRGDRGVAGMEAAIG